MKPYPPREDGFPLSWGGKTKENKRSEKYLYRCRIDIVFISISKSMPKWVLQGYVYDINNRFEVDFDDIEISDIVSASTAKILPEQLLEIKFFRKILFF